VGRTANAVEIRVGVLERLEEKAEITASFIEDLRVTTKPIEALDMTTSAPFVIFRDQK